MDLRSILVNVGLDGSAPHTLAYAVDLARLFDAQLIGVAAEDPMVTYAAIDGGAAAVEAYNVLRDDTERRLAEAGEQFGAAIPATIRSRWNAWVGNPTKCVVEAAIAADLIVTATASQPPLDLRRTLNLGEVILASGRPVLAVAGHATKASLSKVLIGWKDTREARRAVADSLPLLSRATKVLAVTVAEGNPDAERESLDQLKAWLASHGVTADTQVIGNPEGFDDILETTGLTEEVDLVISGGYGHSRMREWLFGGMTRSLLAANSLNRFFSN